MIVSASLLATGCDSSDSADSVVVDKPGKGALSVADDGSGGASLTPPPGAKRWVGTFGAFSLCTREGESVTITSVEVESTLEPLSTTVYLSTLNPSVLEGLTRRERAAYVPLGAELGSPPSFEEPYARSRNREGVVALTTPGDVDIPVTVDCDETGAAVRALSSGRIPSTPYLELLFSLEVDDRGGYVSGVKVRYDDDGRLHETHVDWAMIACGKKVEEKEAC